MARLRNQTWFSLRQWVARVKCGIERLWNNDRRKETENWSFDTKANILKCTVNNACVISLTKGLCSLGNYAIMPIMTSDKGKIISPLN